MSQTLRPWRLVTVLIFMAIAIAFAMDHGGVSAAVTISSFQAKGEASDILITWTTGTEFNNEGFYILRSDSQNFTPYTKINAQMIPGCVGCIVGQNYSYKDTTVNLGQTYYYELESVDNNNGTQISCGANKCPVSAAAGTPTATPTPTNPPTNTPLPPTPTNTPRPTATKTKTPVPNTPTPSNVNPTDTLAPQSTAADYATSPTKFAHLANPSNTVEPNTLDQADTTTPSPSAAASSTQGPDSGSSTTALRVQTLAPTRSLLDSESKPPVSSSSWSVGLTEDQTTLLAMGVLGLAIMGLGLLGGLVGLLILYLRHSY